MHELTTGFRRLIHWRSVEDGVPALAPWTRDAGVRASARDELVASLRSQELWGSMMLDDCSKRAKGLHVGSVTEHKLNGGIVVSMLLSRREREDMSPAFACPACRGAAPAQSTSQLTSTSRTQRVRLTVYAPLRARTLTVGIARSCPKKAASCVRLCDPLVKSQKPDKAQRSQRA